MRTLRTRMPVAVTAALAIIIGVVPAGSVSAQARTLVTFDPQAGQLPEGVAVDANGDVFASLSPLGQLVKVAHGSSEAEPFGQVQGIAEGDFGLIGLAVDADGDVYGAVFAQDPAANGVWRFDATTGAETRIDGTEAIGLPNGVAFGPDGTMYVTDSIAGAVWRVPQGGSAELWIADPLLEGTGAMGLPFPIGANGIAVGDATVYVAVTETARVVSIPIDDDGSAGAASVFAEPEVVGVDGVAVDENGDVYVAAPLDNAVLRVTADGAIETAAEVGNGLDSPTSLAIAIGPEGAKTLYISNFSVALGTELGAGPSIVAVPLDEPG